MHVIKYTKPLPTHLHCRLNKKLGKFLAPFIKANNIGAKIKLMKLRASTALNVSRVPLCMTMLIRLLNSYMYFHFSRTLYGNMTQQGDFAEQPSCVIGLRKTTETHIKIYHSTRTQSSELKQ